MNPPSGLTVRHPPSATLAAVPRIGRFIEIIDRLWRPLVTMRGAMILALVLAALAFTGTLVAQAPSDLEGGSRAYAAWIESLRPRYGTWTIILERLQLFTVFTSIWFRTTVALLAISLVACSASRTRRIWERARHPSAAIGPVTGDRVPLVAAFTTALGPAAALEQVGLALGRRLFRIAIDERPTSLDLVAVRFRWAPFASVITHLSIVVILVGAVVGAAFGFHESRVSIPIGTSVEVGHDTGLSVLAKGFTDLYYPDGSPRDYASHLVLTRAGTPVAEMDVRVNEPLRYGDVSIYQSYFGAAASMRITDSKGASVFGAVVPLELVTADGSHVVGRITLADRATTVYVIAPASGRLDPAIQPGQMEIRIVGPRDPMNARVQILTQGVPTLIDDLTVTFVREARFTGLIVARDPGRGLVWGGAALLVAASLAAFALRERRVWATARPTSAGSEIRLAMTQRRPSGGDLAAFERLTAEIQAAMDVHQHETKKGDPDAEVV